MSLFDKPNASNAFPSAPDEKGQAEASALSRRRFLAASSVAAAAAALPAAVLADLSKAKAAVLPTSVILDALNGVIAFVVPGPDAYSAQQGLTRTELGGVDANAAIPLMYGLNVAGLAPPPFDT